MHLVLVHCLLIIFTYHHFLINVSEAENAEGTLELLGVLVVGSSRLIGKVGERADRVAVFVLHLAS